MPIISAANGILELTTDLAILIGSIIGVYVYSLFASNLTHAGLVFVTIACLGTMAILFVPRAPAGNREANFAWNVFGSFGLDFAEVRRSSTLFYTVVGITWFGFLGSFFLTVIPVFGKSELGLSEARVGLLLALLSIGIGIGSVIAGRLSRKHVEIGLVPLGSVGITIFSLLLARSGTGRIVPILGLPLDTTVDLMLLGLRGGIFHHPAQRDAATTRARRNERTAGRVLQRDEFQRGANRRRSAMAADQRARVEHPQRDSFRRNADARRHRIRRPDAAGLHGAAHHLDFHQHDLSNPHHRR